MLLSNMLSLRATGAPFGAGKDELVNASRLHVAISHEPVETTQRMIKNSWAKIIQTSAAVRQSDVLIRALGKALISQTSDHRRNPITDPGHEQS